MIESESERPRISGYGSVFGERSNRIGFFYEYFDARSMDSTDMDEAVSLFNHNSLYVLGSKRGNTLTITLNERGAIYNVEFPETQLIREAVAVPISRGDVRGSSLIFEADKKDIHWERSSDGIITRYVKKVSKVWEMGPVTFPAYPQTSTEVHKRSFDEFIQEVQKRETHWRYNNAKLRMQL